MTTAAVSGFGTTLTRGGNAIAEVNSIGGVETTLEMLDVTSHDSVDGFKEYIGGLLEAGEVPIEGNFIPGDTNGQIGLITDQINKTIQSFVITFPASIGASWTFSALVSKFKAADALINGQLKFSASLKITGKPTLSIGASAGLTTPFFAISESAVVTPTKSGSTYTYVATVLTGVDSVTVTPTATAGVITVDGNVVATGEASSAIALGAAGSVTEIEVVVTETNKIPKKYTIYLSRAAS